jgi:hypothetical protein
MSNLRMIQIVFTSHELRQFHIIDTVAHFDLELHQMDVKTTFLNWDLKDEVYMRRADTWGTKPIPHKSFPLHETT